MTYAKDRIAELKAVAKETAAAEKRARASRLDRTEKAPTDLYFGYPDFRVEYRP